MTAGASFTEQDLSFVANTRAAGYICVMGSTEKGPLRTPTKVTSWPEFKRIFGDLIIGNDFPWQCRRALERGAKLIVSRVVHYSDPGDVSTTAADEAIIVVNDRQTGATNPYIETGIGPFNVVSAIGANALVFDKDATPASGLTLAGVQATVTNGADATWDLSGNPTLTLRCGRAGSAIQTLVLSSGYFSNAATATAAELAVAINDQLLNGSAVVSGSRVRLDSDIYGTGSRVQVTGGTANAVLLFSTNEQVGSGSAYDLSQMTAEEVTAWITSLGDAQLTVATMSGRTRVTLNIGTGPTYYIGLDAPSTAQDELGFPAIGAGGDSAGLSSATDQTIRFEGKYVGTYSAGIQIQVLNGATDGSSEFSVSIPVQAGVDNAEIYKNLSMDPTDDRYAINILNQESNVIQAVDLTSNASTFALARPAVGTYTLAGGNDGLSSLDEDDFIGDTSTKTGIYAFDAIPGLTSMDIVLTREFTNPTTQILLAYGDGRRDKVVHAVRDMGEPSEVQDVIDFRTAAGAYTGGTNFDSSYGALYCGSVKNRNPLTKVDEYSIPAGELAAILSFNDTGGGRLPPNTYGPWFAPAGLKRGRANVISVEFNVGADNGLLSQLTDDNRINPFQLMNEVPVLGDQFTLLRDSTALQFLNVRRNLIFTEQKVIEAVRTEVFEPNDPLMWRTVFRKIDPIMRDLKGKRAYYDYRVLCDQNATSVDEAVINNPTDIDNGIFRCQVFVKPSKAAREIQINFAITRTDAKFDEIEL